MALPENNITVSQVRNILGEDTNKISELARSSKNNWWGFRKRDNIVGNEWGVQPAEPYKIGDYRGYIHDWRAYALVGVTQGKIPGPDPDNPDDYFMPDLTGPMGWYDGIKFKIKQRYFPSWSIERDEKPLYRVEFKRTSDFHKGGYAVIEESIECDSEDYGDSFSETITIPCDYPPDNVSTPLEPGDTVYVRIKPLSGMYIYDKKMQDTELGEDVIGNNDNDGYVFPLTVPHKPSIKCYIYFEVLSASASSSNYTAFLFGSATLAYEIDGVRQGLDGNNAITAVVTIEMTPKDSMGQLGWTDSQQFEIRTDLPTPINMTASFPKEPYNNTGAHLSLLIKDTYFSVFNAPYSPYTKTGIDISYGVTIQ
ncbi:hypothetical protein ACT29H_01655 [Thermophagus sp. OGC60D27]|uniref:hypothetical protein n=1 Tax=Thermophagus sp. OGC60D27 TaxID=3458415 RepID=UPI0040382753